MNMESIVILGATPSSEALVQQLLKLNISITLIDDEQEKPHILMKNMM